MVKTTIVNKLIEEQKGIIKSLEKMIQLYKTTSDIDEDDTIDPEDFSHQAEAQEMQLHHEQRLIGEKNKLRFLESSLQLDADYAKSGALLETETYYIFIGLAMHPIKMPNKEILCISEKAPLAKELLGKRTGENITIANKELEITAIY